MRRQKKRLPIGIESFEEIRKNQYYYVDKTGLIGDLLNNGSKVILYTRPRRFGKSLNMSMLESFFSPESDKSVFDGLRIAEETQLCRRYMGQHPVIALSLKGLEGGNYETTFRQAVGMINRAAGKVYRQVRDEDRLLPEEMERLSILRQRDMGEADLFDSLGTLSEILERHYDQKVVILIDEYDVPLARAWEDGYYNQMIRLLRNLFQQALKTNDSLQCAVLTGCMRISKESIFTGLNNLQVCSVLDEEYDEYFGFTDEEVRDILTYYDALEYYESVKSWYDGYRFGKTAVYCPWDVICCAGKLHKGCDYSLENYWANSSGNSVVREFIRRSANATLRGEIESLVNGETVWKKVRQNLTYPEMYDSIDNIWSVLFTTGYLTQRGRDGDRLKLAIPNQEVREIFTDQIVELFREETGKDKETLRRFCDALQEGDAGAAEGYLNAYLRRTISVRDTAVRKSMKENFYHGLLIGLLSVRDSWDVMSNQESGDGYCDIQIRDIDHQKGMVIEAKYAENGDLEACCRQALKQIDQKNYIEGLREDGYVHILRYGIAFYKKSCRILLQRKIG